jgi:hypothetical protein
MGCVMGDLTVGVVLMMVTGFLWLKGAILHWHNLKRQERLLGRMRRMSVPEGRGAFRGRVRRGQVGAGPDDRLTAGPLNLR